MRIKHLISPVKVPFFKYKGFGLDEKHFKEAEGITCTCSYEQKNGELLYPEKYYITSKKALNSNFPTQMRGSVKLIIVPVIEFEKYNPEEHD